MGKQENRRPFAVVTGASSGIGYELALVLAAQGYDLLLVARREERLQELALTLQEQHGAAVDVLPIDLSLSGAASVVREHVTARGYKVDLLVNNAGFSAHGPFSQVPLDRLQAIVQVNISALMELTRLMLPDMMAAGGGRILNVSSVVGFMPAPFATVYAATKASVLSFSEGLAQELQGTGVQVTALCPGTTATEFASTAGMTNTLAFRTGSMTARQVAELGYSGMMRGKTVVITGSMNRLTVFATRFAPRTLVAKIAKKLMSQGE